MLYYPRKAFSPLFSLSYKYRSYIISRCKWWIYQLPGGSSLMPEKRGKEKVSFRFEKKRKCETFRFSKFVFQDPFHLHIRCENFVTFFSFIAQKQESCSCTKTFLQNSQLEWFSGNFFRPLNFALPKRDICLRSYENWNFEIMTRMIDTPMPIVIIKFPWKCY